jgi:hypothetical protein
VSGQKFLIRNGKVTSLYKDGSAHAILEKLGGQASIRRASHVEAPEGVLDEIEFQADLTPSNGPILKGFKTYEEAVAAEVQWIKENTLNPHKQSI